MKQVEYILERLLSAPNNISPQSVPLLYYYQFKQFEFTYHLNKLIHEQRSVSMSVTGSGAGVNISSGVEDAAVKALSHAVNIW